MSMFEFSTESNKLRKKLAIHKGAVRSVEFDGSGKFLVSGSKDKSFKVTDVVSI
jgi:WD40 repeat protein